MFEAHKIEITAAALAALPNEMCGVIYDGKFIQLENVHPEPTAFFALSTADTLKYGTSPLTEAFVHSHPGDTLEDGTRVHRLNPSAADMRQQLATNKPWIIAAENVITGAWEYYDWGRHTLDLPILERPFRHGVEDCMTLIAKWWWQNKGVLLPDCPRDDDWWGIKGKIPAKENFYLENYERAGFRRFHPTLRDLRPGDVFLFKVGADVYNHGGIFVGNGLVAHHPPDACSRTAPVGPWFRRIDFWLRRDEEGPS